jgi:hypothetical protein
MQLKERIEKRLEKSKEKKQLIIKCNPGIQNGFWL